VPLTYGALRPYGGLMTPKKTPANFRYRTFASITSPVHLRLVGEEEEDSPTYRDAELRSEPAATGPEGELSARFWIPSQSEMVTVTEVQYEAWTRY